MVGTFYRASAPDAPPYVEEGSVINAGTVSLTTNLATGLDCVGIFHTFKTTGDIFELFQPLDIPFESLASGAWPRSAYRICCRNQGRVWVVGWNITVMARNRVQYYR